MFVSQAFRKFDEMNGKLTEQLRKLAKQVVLHPPPNTDTH